MNCTEEIISDVIKILQAHVSFLVTFWREINKSA